MAYDQEERGEHERDMMKPLIELETPLRLHDKVGRKHAAASVSYDNVFSQKIAQPLFDAGVIVAAIMKSEDYASEAHGRRNYNIFQMVLSGKMAVTLNGKASILEPGQLLWAPSGTEFERKTIGTVWWLYLDFRDVEMLEGLRGGGPHIREYEYSNLLFANLRMIVDAENTAAEDIRPLALECSRFLVRLISQESALVSRGMSPHAAVLNRLADEIAQSPELPWTLDDMVRKAAISKSHLVSLFRKQFGIPPMEAVIKHRMRKAITRMLGGSLKIESVSHAVGYESVASFTRLFTKHVGMSPSRYRKQYSKDGTRKYGLRDGNNIREKEIK